MHLKHVAFSLLLPVVLAACSDARLTEAPTLEPTATTATVYKGRATAVRAKALVANAVLADTGALPTKGGALQTTVVTASVPKLLSTGVLHAATVGQGNHTRSEASVDGLNLSVAGVGVRASFVSSNATTSCSTTGRSSAAGGSQLVGLTVNGKAVTVTGSPNQTVSVLGVKVVINEQTGSASGSTGRKTVNALHVSAAGVADVVVAASSAEITCRTVRPSYGDFITGSGGIQAGGDFSLGGGYKNGQLWGNLSYVDSFKGLTVKGAGVTGYTVVNSTTRLIKGKAVVNGQAGFRYAIRVSDNGAGTKDAFQITVYNGANAKTYTASGGLLCGNLQLHSINPSCACR